MHPADVKESRRAGCKAGDRWHGAMVVP
jgi:hypothetical protein